MSSSALLENGPRAYLKALRDFEPAARFCLSRLGYELVGEGAGWRDLPDYRIYPRRLPRALSAPHVDPYRTPVVVRIVDITSRIGFSHAADGWHPFVQTLREYAADPTLRYEDSTLARVYARYRPANVHEVLLDHLATPLKPFCDWPPVVNLFRWVWAHNRHSVARILEESRRGGPDRAWTHFGPHTEEYGRREFARVIRAYESIRTEGYDSGRDRYAPVDGYFLVRGDRYRFVLLQGNHRVAALKALGHTEVRVQIRRSHPAVIDEAHLHRWTTDRRGLYPPETVAHLFEMLFTETGTDKARRNGLLG